MYGTLPYLTLGISSLDRRLGVRLQLALEQFIRLEERNPIGNTKTNK